MVYTILSEAVGVVGAKFVPAEGINIQALIDGGFIKADKTTSKSAKTVETDTKD